MLMEQHPTAKRTDVLALHVDSDFCNKPFENALENGFARFQSQFLPDTPAPQSIGFLSC